MDSIISKVERKTVRNRERSTGKCRVKFYEKEKPDIKTKSRKGEGKFI